MACIFYNMPCAYFRVSLRSGKTWKNVAQKQKSVLRHGMPRDGF